MKNSIYAIMAAAMVVGSAPALAWNDVDVPVNIASPDKVGGSLKLDKKGHKCVHTGDTSSGPYSDKSTIHVSFMKSGDDCDDNSDKHIDFHLSGANGVPVCDGTIGFHQNQGKDSHYLTVNSLGDFTCIATTINNQPVLDIQ